MTEHGGQITFYFSHLPDGQERYKFVVLGAQALPELRNNRNAFLRYCIDFTRSNDKALLKKIKKLDTKG